MKQRSFASIGLAGLDFSVHGRLTKKAKFLIEMDGLVPWDELCSVIEPHYPKAGNGRPPVGLERMLRIHFLQLWFNLADEACEEALYDTLLFREFAQIDLGKERVPDATTILNFRHLLEKHKLAKPLLERVNALLSNRGLKVSGGTMVDATIIHAPSSTKNATLSRDPEMHQTKKGNQWCVSRTQAADLWCCTEDGSRPPEAGLQEQASNHPVLLRPKGVVVSDRWKRRQ